jgi:RNA polymerase sigma-70 factor (ECF subfamily)
VDVGQFSQLFDQQRGALRRAIALRLDRRVSARIDASDLLQETYLEALRRLPEFTQRSDLPVSVWLYGLARDQVLMCHRRHLGAEMRTALREVPCLPADSSAYLVGSLVSKGPTPSKHLAAAEAAERLRLALGLLDDDARDLILWRHFEQLTVAETAQLLEIGVAAASKRYVRALERLRGLLCGLGEEH